MPGMRTSEIIMLNVFRAQHLQRALAGIDRHGVEALAAQKGIQQAALAGSSSTMRIFGPRAPFFLASVGMRFCNGSKAYICEDVTRERKGR